MLRAFIVIVIAVICLSVTSFATAQQGGTTRYYYDDNGRLRSVILPTGKVIIYQYDPAGNLVSISHQTTTVSITGFVLDSGPVGSTVTITGTGFGATVNENVVLFNGVSAQIVSATTTALVVIVPAGATTGPITVSMPTGTTTSSTSFTVTVPVSFPTISDFTPKIGTPGATVTITGTSFQSTPLNNQVSFNGKTATVVSAAETSITTTVPSGATSGKISVATPEGVAVSGEDFFVPPPPFNASSVEVTGRMAIGETKTVTINTSGKIGLIAFEGIAGRKVSLLIVNSTVPSRVDVRTPSGTVLGSAFPSVEGGLMDAKTLPATGTYTIQVSLSSGRTGSVTFTLFDVTQEATASITAGGPAVTVPTVPGQDASLTFTGAVGQRISILVSELARNSSVALFDPFSTLVASYTETTSFKNTLFIDVQQLQVSGTYRILINPAGPVNNITCTVYDVPPDVAGSILPGGPSVAVPITVPGQNARLTFNGAAGQRLSVLATHPGMVVEISVLRPDLTVLQSSAGAFFDRNYLENITLPAAGTYTLLLNPFRAGIGNIICTLYDVPPDIVATITPGGPPVTVTTTVPGQNAKLTFNSAIGQRFSLLVRFTSTIPDPSFGIFIQSTDGSFRFTSERLFAGEGFIDVFGVQDRTATFNITLSPSDDLVGSFTATLYDVPPDINDTITPGGAPITVTTTVPGQNAKLTFNGVAGQKISLKATGASGFSGSVFILRPNGNFLDSGSLNDPAQELFIDAVVLPVSGTYSISINPSRDSIGTKTFTLYNVNDVSGTIEIGGPPITVNLDTPGQNANLTFNAANQRVTVHVTNNITGCVEVELIGPDGSGFTNFFSCDSNTSFDLDPQDLLPGAYTIRINPKDASTGSVVIRVTSP